MAMKFRGMALATAALTITGLTACERPTSLDGVWEVRRFRTVSFRGDSTGRRIRTETIYDPTGATFEGVFFLFDESGHPVKEDGEDTPPFAGEDVYLTRSEVGAVLVSPGSGVRTSPTGDCGFLVTCRGDTTYFDLEWVGNRKGGRPANAEYVARTKAIAYWRSVDSDFGAGLEWRDLRRNRARVDSLSVRDVDTAVVAYVRAVGAVLGELALLGDERSLWDPTMSPLGFGSGIFRIVQTSREKLTSVSTEGSTGSLRAQQLLRRLDDIEQDALRLWRREGSLRAQLSARYRFNFPALRVFEGSEPI